jgi:histidine triad (HIT) family protein
VNDCTFCDIVAGRVPSYRVLEDEHTMAFLGISPRVHARDLREISVISHAQVAGMVHRVAALLRRALTPEGAKLVRSTGDAAGQDVLHFHVHVIPRWRGDDLRRMCDSDSASASDLQRVLERIAANR